MIIHDLKNPLTGIMSYSQYLQASDKIQDEKLLSIFRSIYSSCQDILHMVMNLLDIGKMEEGKLNLNLSLISLPEMINEILEKLDIKLLKRRIKVIKIIPEDLPLVSGDKNSTPENYY